MLHTLTKTSNVGHTEKDLPLTMTRANGQDAVSSSVKCDRACFMSERPGDFYLATGACVLLFPLKLTLCVWCITPRGMLGGCSGQQRNHQLFSRCVQGCGQMSADKLLPWSSERLGHLGSTFRCLGTCCQPSVLLSLIFSHV